MLFVSRAAEEDHFREPQPRTLTPPHPPIKASTHPDSMSALFTVHVVNSHLYLLDLSKRLCDELATRHFVDVSGYSELPTPSHSLPITLSQLLSRN